MGISLQYINMFLNMICGLFLSAFLLRSLGDTEYGIYQTISSFVNYLVLLEFGVSTVITRNIVACRAQNDESGIQKNISTIWSITSILTGIIVLVGVIFYFLLGTIYAQSFTEEQIQYGKQIFLVVLAFLVASVFSNTLNGILLGFEKYSIPPIITLVRLLSRTLTLVFLILVFRKSIVIACVDLFCAVMVDAWLIIYCHKKLHFSFSFRYFDRSVFRNSLPLATAIFIQTLVNQANSNVDKFVIGIKLGPEEVTVYSVGLFIYNVFSSLTTIPITMYAPQVVKEISNGYKPNDVSTHLISPSRLIVIVGGCVLFAFFAVGKQFISIVYGDSYNIAWKIALIIMVPMLINMSNGIMINILDATNKRMARSGVLLLTTIGNIILTVLWIDKYGIMGACIATAVCTLLGQITLMDIYYYKSLGIKVLSFKMSTYKGIVVWQLVASVIAFFVAKSISNMYASFFVGSFVFITVFCVTFLLFGATAMEKKLVNKYWQVIKNKKLLLKNRRM